MEARRSFPKAFLVLLFLSGCGCGADKYDRSGIAQLQNGGNCVVTGTAFSIEELHSPNHSFSVPAADVSAGIEQSYTLLDSGSGHSHEVTLSAAHFAALRAAQGVRVRSTGWDGHAHYVTFHCL